MLDIIIFGVQGSGKGTQSQLLLERFPNVFSYFATGDIFRALTSSANAIGNYVKERISQGQMVSDGVTNAIFEAYFHTVLDEKKYMLLDGYPRNMMQMEELVKLMRQYNRPVLGIHFVLPEEMAIQRIKARGRADDTDESIRKRLQRSKELTLPMIEHFKEHMPLIELDATPDIEHVAVAVAEAIEHHKMV